MLLSITSVIRVIIFLETIKRDRKGKEEKLLFERFLLVAALKFANQSWFQ